MQNVHADWKATNETLGKDVVEAACKVEKHPTDFNKRVYVRAVFAAIEGDVFGMKRVTLEHSNKVGYTLSSIELGKLSESKTESNGKTIKPKFLPFGDNIKFTFEVFIKSHGFTFQPNYQHQDWNCLLKSVEIRHRLMHPKKHSDLIVSQIEMDMILDGSRWYFWHRAELFNQAIEAIKRSQLA